VKAHTFNRIARAGIVGIAVAAAGCGQVSRQGRAPVQIVISSLEGASGAQPDKWGATLFSDVVTNVKQKVGSTETLVPTVFADNGKVVMTLVLKDPGQPGAPTATSGLNAVTFNRSRVAYRRTDGRNAPGVDVPYPFDSAVTFTVPADGSVTSAFEIVRHNAKEEAPLAALRNDNVIIGTLAEVSFFGRDQAGNDVTATGTIGVEFGNFGDPQ
jgi:hypothetical protein